MEKERRKQELIWMIIAIVFYTLYAVWVYLYLDWYF